MKEILGLGISGAELILRQLKKINKAKDDFKKPAAFKASAAIQRIFAPKGPSGEPVTPTEPKKVSPEEKTKTKEYDRGKEVGGAAKEAGQAVGNLEGTALTQAGIKGITALGGPVGLVVGEIVNRIIDAATAFRDKVKQAASIHADTLDAQNTAIRYAGKGFEEYIKSSRSDLDRNTQRAIISGLGTQYGRFTEEFRGQIEKLFGQKINGKYADLGETSALAGGNFAALGTDKGFFMQKIANSLSDLPPSIKQKLMGQLLEAVPAEERTTQTGELTRLRSAVTEFNDSERSGQASFVTKNNLDLAKEIQNLTNTLDTKLAGGIEKLIGEIRKMAASESPSDYALTQLKSAIMDLKSVFTGAIKSAF